MSTPIPSWLVQEPEHSRAWRRGWYALSIAFLVVMALQIRDRVVFVAGSYLKLDAVHDHIMIDDAQCETLRAGEMAMIWIRQDKDGRWQGTCRNYPAANPVPSLKRRSELQSRA